MPKRKACDRCYRYKQKCNFEDHEERCIGCKESASTCITTRLHQRQGRRPKVQNLGPQDTVQVWDIEGVEEQTNSTDVATKGTMQQGPPTEIDDEQPQSRLAVGLALARVSEGSTSEKCPAFETPRLNLYCSHIPTLESPWLEYSPKVIEHFYETYDLFMLGPTFASELRTAYQNSYYCSPVLLHDILVALFTTTNRARYNIGHDDQNDIAKGAVSLQRLRTARISGLHDVFAIIALGQSLAAFDLLTNCLGSTSILRYSLSSIKPWYEEVSRNPSLDPVAIASILWDTVSCLVKREIPVIKHISRDAHVIDRMAGLCTTLLPMFYDLCVASKTVKSHLETGSEIDTSVLEEIQEQLQCWAPEPPSDLTSTFSNQEVLRMKAQASLYRTAGLLLCHRILNPIGTKDDVAGAYATSILVDFSKYSVLVMPKGLQNVAFPVLLAAFEIPNVSHTIWRFMTLSAAAPVCVAKISALIEFVWKERRRGTMEFLLDLVHQGPDFVVIP